MEAKDVTVSLETKTTPVLKPTLAITETISKEIIKIMELTESCKTFESYLKDFELKIELLLTSKSESTNLKSEYLARNRINMTNTESLRVAKNELYKYKCELKADYIATEKALKSKRFKYKNIIESYESDWQKTLQEYYSNPVVTELRNLEEENSILGKKFDELNRLYDCTRNEFLALRECTRKKFIGKVVEFSKDMLLYKTVLQRRIQEEKQKQLEGKEQKPGNIKLNLFKDGILKMDVQNSDGNSEVNNFSGVDVSVFDEMMIPIQNLETQNEEELFPLLQTESKPLASGGGLDKTELMDWKGESSQVLHSEKQDKESAGQFEGKFNPSTPKIAKVIENESQYFQSNVSKQPLNDGMIQGTECWNETEMNYARFGGKDEEFEEITEPATGSKPNNEKYRNEEEFSRYLQGTRDYKTDSEGNVSDGSCENQYDCLIQNKSLEDKQRGFYEYQDDFEGQYRNTPPTSEEEIPRGMSADTTNESGGSPEQPPNENQNASGPAKNEFKAQEEGFKSFANFFTMGDDNDSSKPSIFKLF